MTKPQFKPLTENKFVKLTNEAFEVLRKEQNVDEEAHVNNLFRVLAVRKIKDKEEYRLSLVDFLEYNDADSECIPLHVLAENTYQNQETVKARVNANLDEIIANIRSVKEVA